MKDLTMLEQKIEDAFIIATTQEIKTDAAKRHFRFCLKQIASCTIDKVRKRQSKTLYEINEELK